jgi:hypothetical protein
MGRRKLVHWTDAMITPGEATTLPPDSHEGRKGGLAQAVDLDQELAQPMAYDGR